MTVRRERLERTILKERTDRVPVAIWRHFPGDDQRSADLANAIMNYQMLYDWDYVVVASARDYAITGYDVTTEWRGDLCGHRLVTRSPIRRSLDWTELRPLDVRRGELAKLLACLALLGNIYDAQQIPYLPMVYSPLMQASLLAGEKQLVQHLRRHPDRVQSGLNTLTESTMRLMEALRRLPITGIVYVVGQADYQVLTPQEYQQFGVPYDRKILDLCSDKWWMNILQLEGQSPMLPLFADYPMQVLQWDDQNSHVDLLRAGTLFRGALHGGLDAEAHLNLGTPSDVRTVARRAIQTAEGVGLILGSMMTPITCPMSNLSTCRDVVEIK